MPKANKKTTDLVRTLVFKLRALEEKKIDFDAKRIRHPFNITNTIAQCEHWIKQFGSEK